MAPLAKVERSHKRFKTGTPGIILSVLFRKKVDYGEYRFRIVIPNRPIRTVYIGTTNTWEMNYKRKLRYAEEIYDEMKGEE